MAVSKDNLFGLNKLVPVDLLKIERREIDGKPGMVVLGENVETKKQTKFGVLNDALEAFAQHTDEVSPGKYRSLVPAEFLGDGKKIKWINTSY